MDQEDSGQLQFRGQDATECEDFIRAISKHAFSQGKQRDDQWIADLAATCMANEALRWWGALDEEVQGSWKLLRKAMLSKYRPMFYGGSGEEAEKFIRAVCDKAIDDGKQKDNEWIVAYGSSCLAGEALRWYAHLDSDTQENWKKLQQALLIQYPRSATAGPTANIVPTPPAAASFAPAPKVTRRGRIRISNSDHSTAHYLSKRLPSDNRISSTSSTTDVLELEWSTGSDGGQILSIPGSQIPGYDLLGVKWHKDDPAEYNNYLAFCVVDSQTHSTSLFPSYAGNLLTNKWKISPKGSDGVLTVSVVAAQVTVCPKWNAPHGIVWFSEDQYWSTWSAEFFFEPI